MLKGRADDLPPPGIGFSTEIEAHPSVVRSAAGTVADSCVLVTKLVARGVPLNSTVESLLKPDPFTVITVSVEPLAMVVGEIEEMTGATL